MSIEREPHPPKREIPVEPDSRSESCNWPADVVLIEDAEPDVVLLREALGALEAPITLRVCKDGEQALASIDTDQPDLVFLDLNLPGLSGHGVLQRLREDAATRRLPVIVLSSSTRPRDIADSYSLGANAYLPKPVGLEAYRAMLRAVERFWFHEAALPPKPKVA